MTGGEVFAIFEGSLFEGGPRNRQAKRSWAPWAGGPSYGPQHAFRPNPLRLFLLAHVGDDGPVGGSVGV